VLAALALVTACQSTAAAPNTPVPTQRAAPRALEQSIASSQPSTPSPIVPEAKLAKRTGMEAGFGPITGSNSTLFRCGSSSCKSGVQTCCATGDESVCASTVPAGPNDNVQVLAAQLQACADALGQEVSDVARCDESGDCAGNEACCEQYLYSGSTARVCVPFGPGKATPCEFGERCQEGQPCRVGNAECVDGACRKRIKNRRCGSATCGPGTSCCDFPARCAPHAECADTMAKYHCSQASDCLAGERCWYANGQSNCINYPPIAGVAALVCTGDADCPTKDTFCEGPVRCVAAADGSPVRVCTCPSR
jgi:hypothetical protein